MDTFLELGIEAIRKSINKSPSQGSRLLQILMSEAED